MSPKKNLARELGEFQLCHLPDPVTSGTLTSQSLSFSLLTTWETGSHWPGDLEAQVGQYVSNSPLQKDPLEKPVQIQILGCFSWSFWGLRLCFQQSFQWWQNQGQGLSLCLKSPCSHPTKHRHRCPPTMVTVHPHKHFYLFLSVTLPSDL